MSPGRQDRRPAGSGGPAPRPFAVAVWDIVSRVPAGKVTTYAEVAEAHFGMRRGARAVGSALARCPNDVPWWRVVRADGRLPGTVADGEHRARLADEGVALVDGGTRVAWGPVGGPWSPPRIRGSGPAGGRRGSGRGRRR